jgi:flagellar biosynthesis protein FlhG
MDAYATVKLRALNHDVSDIAIVANRINGEAMGRDLYRRFRDVSARFLSDTRLSYLGGIPDDERVRTAASRRRCVVDQYPHARSAQAIAELARTIDSGAIMAQAGGDCFFGMEAVAGVR